MSDLSGGNCGCNDSCGCIGTKNNECGCNSFIWILLLLFLCNGNGIGIGQNGSGYDNNCCGSGFGFSCSNNCCEWIIWILLISCFCGSGNSFGFGCRS